MSCPSLATKVDLLGLNLVRNVQQHHVEVMVALVVWREGDLDNLVGVGRDGGGGRLEHERRSGVSELHSLDQRVELVSHRERADARSGDQSQLEAEDWGQCKRAPIQRWRKRHSAS